MTILMICHSGNTVVQMGSHGGDGLKGKRVQNKREWYCGRLYFSIHGFSKRRATKGYSRHGILEFKMDCFGHVILVRSAFQWPGIRVYPIYNHGDNSFYNNGDAMYAKD
ncbi:hypothetical protein Leryth_007286 [Lithospermum erythrorhizon]|nr:hypothetical protein Leryth_007286 [Lithospermum erythrorhizon]